MNIKTIESRSVDEAWETVAMHMVSCSKSPAIALEIKQGVDCETSLSLRRRLDASLLSHGVPTTRETALAIFPYEFWKRRKDMSCEDFCRICVKRLYPRMKARNTKNRYGVYFERIMAWGKDGKGQLTTVVEAMKASGNRPRESMLQLAVYDPGRDLTKQRMRGFPCLQQLVLTQGTGRSFDVNALYPVQYIYERAYGNYLGLSHLGRFIAEHTGWKFEKLNVITFSPRIGQKGSKRLLRELCDSQAETSVGDKT